MSTPSPWGRTTGIPAVVLVILIGFGAVLFLVPDRKSIASSKVTVFDPRLSILCVQMRIGSNAFYLPAEVASKGFGSSIEGRLRDRIHRLGIHINTLDEVRPGVGASGRAFLIGYTFPVPPTSSVHLAAELVAEDGTIHSLLSKAGGGGGPPERSWNLWTLDSLPSGVTNYALRLKLETNGMPVAEIRFVEP